MQEMELEYILVEIQDFLLVLPVSGNFDQLVGIYLHHRTKQMVQKMQRLQKLNEPFRHSDLTINIALNALKPK